jgi:hypothetical protein
MLAGCVRRYILLVPLAAALALLGCDSYTSDIAAVKRAKTLPGRSNEELVMDLAGARASIEWTAERSKVYDSDDIIAVTAEINRPKQMKRQSRRDEVMFEGDAKKVIRFFLPNGL